MSVVELELKAVDRERDIVQLMTVARRNHAAARTDGKQELPYSSQMFGAGKTVLGKNALPLLLADLARPASQQRIVPQLLKDGWTLDEVKKYVSAHPVFVDLTKDLPEKTSHIPTFRLALYCALYRAATGDRGVKATEVVKRFNPEATALEFVNSLCTATGKSLFYFFIDEIGQIEELATVANGSAFDDLARRQDDPQRVLLQVLAPLLPTSACLCT